MRPPLKRLTGILFSTLGILLIVYLDSRFGGHGHHHNMMTRMSYSLALMTGFMTSFHCVGMCGALVLSYTTQDTALGRPSYLSHLWYGLGKTLSYTGLGAAFATLGAIIAFTPNLKGIISLSAGIFLILFGLSMLNLIPGLRHFQLRTPSFVMRFIGRQYKKHSHPMIIGVLNGLMIVCGPLQAMYIMAAGTGDPHTGAALLFFFGIGTLPIMLGFGLFASTLAKNIGQKLVKFSSVVVLVLGALMLNRGLALTTTGYDMGTLTAKLEKLTHRIPQTLKLKVGAAGFEPNHFVVSVKQPVRWEIEVEEKAFCKSRLIVPSLDVSLDLKPGLQAVEFAFPRPGLILWYCEQPLTYGAFTVQ